MKKEGLKKPRMLFDIACFWGSPHMSGLPRYCIEMLTRLMRRGDFDITLVCSLPDEETVLRHYGGLCSLDLPFQSKDVEHYILPDKPTPPRTSRLKRCEDWLKRRFPNNRVLAASARAARCVKWLILPPSAPGPLRPRSAILERLVEQSDVYFSPYFELIPELSVKPSIRKILVVHDLIPLLFPQMYPGHLFSVRIPMNSVTPDTQVIADSESTRRDVLDRFPSIKPEQITAVALAADARFHRRPDPARVIETVRKYFIPDGAPYVFSVASFDPRKNFEHVMRSFAALLRKNGTCFPDLRLLLTGTLEKCSPEVKKAYGSLPPDLRDRVIFAGYVADEDLPFLYAGARCFCLMSLYEGFGLPPLEAMSCGTPVIVSNCSSLPEVVGDAGVLLDPHDETGLVAALERLLSDDAYRKTLIEKGFERAARFSWDRCVEETVRMIGE